MTYTWLFVYFATKYSIHYTTKKAFIGVSMSGPTFVMIVTKFVSIVTYFIYIIILTGSCSLCSTTTGN